MQRARTPSVSGSWCIRPFVCSAKPRLRAPSLEHALQHGCGVGGPRLPALDGAAEVLDPAAAFPDLLKLPGEDLGAPLPREARLLQAQLAHLHVVLSCEKKRVRKEKKDVKRSDEELKQAQLHCQQKCLQNSFTLENHHESVAIVHISHLEVLLN